MLLHFHVTLLAVLIPMPQFWLSAAALLGLTLLSVAAIAFAFASERRRSRPKTSL